MEKRRFSRIPFRVETEITGSDFSFEAEVKNISLKGMFLKTERNLTVGMILAIKIRPAGSPGPSVSVQGKVYRTTPEGAGIFFEEMDLESFVLLKNIVSYNTGDPTKINKEYENYIINNFSESPTRGKK